MSYRCVDGHGICEHCGNCQEEKEVLRCDYCGEEIEFEDYYYDFGNEIACEDCVIEEYRKIRR